ncbi:hypothetical protein SBOR_0067 [Sclerotinia borealis F-4128]|uniref:Uncharacterized protein n=1 Tax=Sclerotinia borealis (strain F-4128) TaxID=1432307 RepID=W9CRT0_SCLBF|nr:hypothetical protein SBOR_0067 [Sclerotinia borealis F-4128]
MSNWRTRMRNEENIVLWNSDISCHLDASFFDDAFEREIEALKQGSRNSDRGKLFLDGVSSSVNFETEWIIWEMIREEFGDYTVVRLLRLVIDWR